MAKFGYTHPLHPPMTSITLGMVVGAFTFEAIGLALGRPNLEISARHCIVFALAAFLPTIVLGYADWHHYYHGALLEPIKMKMALASVLLILLAGAFSAGRNASHRRSVILTFYALCLLTVGGLGFFGGELVFGSKPSAAAALQGNADRGKSLFEAKCTGCHYSASTETKMGPGLKGIFARSTLPVSGLPATEEDVRKQLSSPYQKMPSFSSLPEGDVDALIAYLKTL